MKTMILSLLVVSPVAIAAPVKYQIDVAYIADGKSERKSRLIVEDGKSAEIYDLDANPNDGAFVGVVPTRIPGKDGNKDQIKLDFILGTLENGHRRETGRPMIVALEGEEATIEMTEKDKDGKTVHVMRAAATVTRAD